MPTESERHNRNQQVARWSCAIEVGQNVTEEFGLITIYESFEPQFLLHLTNLTNCSSAGDADAIQTCFDQEGQSARDTYIEFYNLVHEVCPSAVEKSNSNFNRKFSLYLCSQMKKPHRELLYFSGPYVWHQPNQQKFSTIHSNRCKCKI